MIHRDIKPQNAILAPDGVVHLIDFDIVRTFGPEAAIATGGIALPMIDCAKAAENFCAEQGAEPAGISALFQTFTNTALREMIRRDVHGPYRFSSRKRAADDEK